MYQRSLSLFRQSMIDNILFLLQKMFWLDSYFLQFYKIHQYILYMFNNKSKPKTISNFQNRQPSAMKDEKSVNKLQNTNQNKQIVTDGPQGASNQRIQYFCFTLKGLADQSDNTVAWNYNVPILMPNQKSLYLATQGFTTVIQDYIGDDFPQTISLGIESVSGFVGFDGAPSNKIMVLTLADINTTFIDGVVSRDLIYKNEVSAFWSLGSRNLIMRVYTDLSTNPVEFPIQNPISVTFKIVHLTL